MKIEKDILFALNQPLVITERPFRQIAKKTGIKEERLLSALKKYKKNGLLRRFGAILNHQKIGLKTNALVALTVKNHRVNKVAKILIKAPEISHCYLRSDYPFWPYNLYVMLHATTKKDCRRIIKRISQKTKIKNYKVLYTQKEFKKERLDLNRVLK
jgi:DNA-binding Lrp family transcriptional regulator